MVAITLVGRFSETFHKDYNNLNSEQKKFVDYVIKLIKSGATFTYGRIHTLSEFSDSHVRVKSIDIPDDIIEINKLLAGELYDVGTKRLIYEEIIVDNVIRILFTNCGDHTYISTNYYRKYK